MWRESALLAALYLAGQGTAVALTEAPPFALYQHLRSWATMETWQRALLVVPLLQLALATRVLVRRRTWLVAACQAIGARRLTIAIAVVAFGLAVPTASLVRFAGEWVLAALIGLAALGNLIALATALPAAPLARLFQGLRLPIVSGSDDSGRSDRWWKWGSALVVLVMAGVTSRVVLDGVPHIDDSVSNLFQAKHFAAGALTAPGPPDSAAFQVDEVIIDGTRWFGYAFPGWPAVLSLGVLVGVPWLINPLLGAVAVLLSHVVARRLFGSGTANLTVVLLALSPWMYFMSGEFLGHPISLVLFLLAVVAMERADSTLPRRWSVVAGLSLGALALTRPLDAALVGGALMLWYGVLRRPRLRVSSLAWCIGAAIVVGALLPLYNHALTGDARYTPQMMWTDRAWGAGSDRFGFGADVGIRGWPAIDPLPGHGPVDVFLNANKNVFAANVELFGWATGSLLLALVAMFRPRAKPDQFLVLLVLSVVIGYSAYWFSGGPDIGPRYWYPLIAPLAMLTARAIEIAPVGVARARVVAVVSLACVSAILVFVPWRWTTKYQRYRNIGGEIRDLTRQHDWDRALVFVRAEDSSDYQAAFNFNSPHLGAQGPVLARDAGAPSRSRVVAAFPDREVWVLSPGIRGRLRVVMGPLSPGTIPPDAPTVAR